MLPQPPAPMNGNSSKDAWRILRNAKHKKMFLLNKGLFTAFIGRVTAKPGDPESKKILRRFF